MVHFCSHAYRTANVSEHLLHRQISPAQRGSDSGLSIALQDAFVFQQCYFPNAYDYNSGNTTASYMLLERAVLFVKRRKSKIQILNECNLLWARLLIKLFTTPESTCTSWPASQLVELLFSLKPQAFYDAELRQRYPRLLKGPGVLLREFLTNNATALYLYGSPHDSDEYGILRLKLMGCLIAHLQDLYSCVNIDALLSRTDIMYLSHVGGVLHPTIINHEFVSNIFNIFRGDNVSNQLNLLVRSGLPVMLITVPNPLSKLAFKSQWTRYYTKRLPDHGIETAIQSRVSSLSLSVPVPTNFVEGVVHFPEPAKRLEVLEQPAAEDDFIRDEARQVFAQFVQQNTPRENDTAGSDEDDRLLSQPIHTVDSGAANRTGGQNNIIASTSSAMFSFPPPIIDSTAMYGRIVVTPNPFSQYVAPTAHYQLRDMQRITNWHHLAHFIFQGEGSNYVRTLTCHDTITRPLTPGSNVVFLYSVSVTFTPNTPFDSLFHLTHLWYTVSFGSFTMVYRSLSWQAKSNVRT
jgi:hypothetical protein